ncbi:aldehyde dehydrogenase family protein [bacterium]|nr:aldehyde dehydrogenase family protein [bacterium]
MIRLKNYIDGRLEEPQSGDYLDGYEPATGQVYSQVPDSDNRDVERAVRAAQRAFPGWKDTPASERSKLLLKLSALIERDLEKLASAESRDNGKPIGLARVVDIPRARDNFAFYATAILHEESEAHLMGTSGFNYTLRHPLGVAGCIAPWNLPLYLFSWKIAPALASGNTVVAKPSEVTPMTAFMLSELCIEAGFPPGVLNIVHGLGPKVGEAICSHPEVPVLSFTGGTATGKRIAQVAAPMFKKMSLELGGKNPNILFADCDFDLALKTTLQSSFANQGQICLCGSRILIERSMYERFRDAFVERVRQLRVGPPSREDSKLGALVSQAQFEKVQHYVDLAREEGGRILCGGAPVQLEGEWAGGWYFEPTVIEGLGPQCRVNQEEIFGPVVTLQAFDTVEEALQLANDTTYGLSSTVWTSSLEKAHRVAAALHTGIVWINCWLVRDLRTPFGGVKQSGIGREGGFEVLRFFTEPKNVCVALPKS